MILVPLAFYRSRLSGAAGQDSSHAAVLSSLTVSHTTRDRMRLQTPASPAPWLTPRRASPIRKEVVALPVSIVGPVVPQNMYVPNGVSVVPANPDPDETVLMDYGIARSKMITVFSRDGVIDPQEQAVIDAFDQPYRTHGIRYHSRRVFESVMRNGLTKRTAASAKEVGIAIVIGEDNYPANVIPFPVGNPQSA